MNPSRIPSSRLLRLPSAAAGAVFLMLASSSCKSVLTTWHAKSYTPVVDLSSPLVEPSDAEPLLEQVADLSGSADELYSQGYVLVGYTKFSHTLVPGFQATYAKMYADRLGAARVLQAEPRQDADVYAYTVTYWAKGREFPFGAYYNDIPDETAMYFPDSLRETIDDGDRPVVVEAVVYGSPAESAGLKKGELIVAVNGASIRGADGLDALVAEHAEQEVELTVWGLSGLRQTTCTVGPRFVCADGYGVEGLYYNQPWAFDKYRNFEQYSHAFVDAWNAGIEAQRQAEEQARRDAQYAYMSSEISSLQGRIDELERQPSQRGSRQTRIELAVERAGFEDSLQRDWNLSTR